MSAQRRFKGNFLYNTTNSELVFNSLPIEIPDTPGPGTYVEPSLDSVSNLFKNKESASKGGFGVGFASKTNRFPEQALKTGVMKPQNLQLELIYARASSTPGPGHYNNEKDWNGIGGKVFMEKTKRNWNLLPKTFSFNKKQSAY
jgi:hypothetical protein